MQASRYRFALCNLWRGGIVNLKRSRIFRQLRARPRLLIAVAVVIAVGLVLPVDVTRHAVTRWLVAWNAGAGLYVVLAAVMMTRSSEHHMRHRAQLQDEGQVVILVLVVVAAVASLAAIAGQLTVVKTMHGALKVAHVSLAGMTGVTSWAFIQVMFALHYAHDYYVALTRGHPAGLQFPGDDRPGYGDFFYFSAVIGTSGQTADVSFVSKEIRRVGSVHCILAYVFNTTVLALLINIGAGLL